MRYSSDDSNKKPHKPTGTTIKPEECTFESRYSKSQKAIPPCEAQPDGSCPAYDTCRGNGEQKSQNKKDSGFEKNGKYKFHYWHLLAALIVTGVAGYKVIYQKIVISKAKGIHRSYIECHFIFKLFRCSIANEMAHTAS